MQHITFSPRVCKRLVCAYVWTTQCWTTSLILLNTLTDAACERGGVPPPFEYLKDAFSERRKTHPTYFTQCTHLVLYHLLKSWSLMSTAPLLIGTVASTSLSSRFYRRLGLVKRH